MTFEQAILFPLTGRFYSFSEIERIVTEAADLIIKSQPDPVFVRAEAPGIKRRSRRHAA